ncbi:hypothetical protein XENTR_v10012564 [Xenopus tropicalis]|nr:hypothetical protein XENTR_v10012564 [Xenopus tropicalis]
MGKSLSVLMFLLCWIIMGVHKYLDVLVWEAQCVVRLDCLGLWFWWAFDSRAGVPRLFPPAIYFAPPHVCTYVCNTACAYPINALHFRISRLRRGPPEIHGGSTGGPRSTFWPHLL